MRPLSTRIHGLFDYFIGIMLVGLPWLLDFQTERLEAAVFTVAGMALLVSNLLTNHELGLVQLISVPLHFAADVVIGTFLAAAPWMFDFADVAITMHLLFGMLLIGSTFLTVPQAGVEWIYPDEWN